MDDDPTPIITKRRRTSKNCVACRKSKVKCDRKIPCTRCSKLRVPCQYFEVPKDPNAEKLEELQIEIAHLKSLLSSRAEVNQQATPTESLHTSIAQTNPFDQIIAQHQSPLQNDAALENADLLSAHFSGGSSITTSSWHGVARDFALSQSLPGDPPIIHQAYRQEPPRCGHNDSFHGSSTFYIRQSPLPDAVVCRIAAPGDAERWFNCFFEGSDRLIPVFSNADTFTSVRQRSSLLFDVLLTVGCKIHCGSNSAQYQSMHHHLRQRISTYVLSSLMIHSVETVQALLVLACYWEKSWLFMDLALWMTQELKLPDAVEQMMTRMAGEGPRYLSSSGDLSVHDKALFQMARVCCGVYVLDKIFSLDGGKTSGIASSPNPRRLRCLLNHPSRSAIDFRLLSQVELNSLRAHIHATLTPPAPASTAAAATTTITTTAIPDTLPDPHVATTLRNARLDLALWLSDWTALARAEPRLPTARTPASTRSTWSTCRSSTSGR